jgi:tetrahydromethanopterin S-methyltransferase subunit B
MTGHDWMTAAAIEMSVDPKLDAGFVEEYKDGLVIGLEVIGLIALVADIFALVVS